MTEEQIHIICKQYDIKNYIINEDMSIDVNGNVYLGGKKLDKLPLRFRKISGNYSCSSNKLIHLEGSPTEVGGYFHCGSNNLPSLEGCPLKVSGDFYCSDNQLTSLEDGPQFIGGKFYCSNNPIYNEFFDKFNLDYNLYLKYIHRQKVLKQLIDD